MKLWKATVLATLTFGVIGTAQAELELYAVTNGKPMSLNYEQCIKNAKQVLFDVGFKDTLEQRDNLRGEDGSGAAWGRRGTGKGRYAAVIRCHPEQNMAFFVVTGFDSNANKVREWVNQLKDGFTAD